MSLRVVYLGTPAFATAPLQVLSECCDVALVCTAPDAIRGRGRKSEPTPVKALAETLGIPVCCPRSLGDETIRAEIEAIAPDVVVVAAYALLLPEWLLALPRFGCINIHGSLLPRWRGAAPIERAILAGDGQSGISIMRMEAGLDTGPYALQRSVGIGEKSCDEISSELSAVGAEALRETLEGLERGSVLWTEQDDREATYASKLARGELNCAPEDVCRDNLRRVQASSAAHPSRCAIDAQSVTLLRCRALRPEDVVLAEGLTAGDVAFRQKLLLFGCVDGVFAVEGLKPDGRRAMDAASFVAGKPSIRKGGAHWSALDR